MQKKDDIFYDEWPKKYPHGKKALRKAIRKAAKSKIFDIEKDEDLVKSR